MLLRTVRLCVGIASFVIACPSAFAQSQSGSVAGVVRDTTGAVMPGVTVEVASPSLIEKVRVSVSDDHGEYRVIQLPPGKYTVTFSLPGFSSLKREGLELTANFTANVDGELRVGAVEETVTVSGQTPVVDVQNVIQQKTMSRDLLDTVPSGSKTPIALANLIPAAIVPPTARDVGGSRGEQSARIAIHGATQGDQKLMFDGMRVNNMVSDGTGRGYFMNPTGAEEVVVAMGTGGSAEYSTGGVQINLVPKNGGNQFSVYGLTNYTNQSLQSSNLDAELRTRGLLNSPEIRRLYDFNVGVGGPMLKDRLWFYSAHRRWGDRTRPPNVFFNDTQNTLVYTPNPSRPADQYNWYKAHSARFTWQASEKDRITAMYEWEHSCNCLGSTPLTSTTAFEAATGLDFKPQYLVQATWTRPASTRLLFEAGAALVKEIHTSYLQDGVSPNAISVLDQGRNIRYNAPVSWGPSDSSQLNQRFSMSYVTGSHHFKTGVFFLEGWADTSSFRNPEQISYTFNNGVPISVTQYLATHTRQELKPEFGLYAQDQWTIQRLTLNYGVRLDAIHSLVPANETPASRFAGARSFAEVDCVPCWKDLSPRFAASYDVFGTGRTAVKGSISRYVQAHTVSIAATADPVNASINSVTRRWTDSNGNFVPDCDLHNYGINGECLAISNPNFGNTVITTRYDPDLVNGWQKRPYNWQLSGTIEHELRPGIAVNAGYFRTWYGNFFVTDNLARTPADYTEYCFNAPRDARIPGGGGDRICGLYDVSPAKFPLVDNLITFASDYGDQRHVFDGFDVGATARLNNGGMVAGGVALGNNVSTAAFGGTSSTTRCFVVDSPQELRFCDQPIPLQTNFKIFGSYPLPLAMQVSANFQNTPGTAFTATYNASAAETTLGRAFAGGAATVPVELIQNYTQFEGRVNQFDVRVSKEVRIGRVRVQGTFDAYNLLNDNSVLNENLTFGPNWRVPLQILEARLLKVGARVEF